MDPSQIQAEMIKWQSGPSYGFIKIRLGVRRILVLKTGSIEVKFMFVDVSIIMFTMQIGKDTSELKEFVLNQPKAYEIKIGDHVFRRPGDPPLEKVIKKLHEEKSEAHDHSSKEEL
ncbi:hypothetical protein NE237_012552 [Protea cynaroides]|uniref:Uncharacterized protein n=1 Tax=Protea cynaroides TaxID=273540 RepID=A0A9Q0GY64_9MAGN|nr:hypothetical protein NE237_012552 [Protea cynaroides]